MVSFVEPGGRTLLAELPRVPIVNERLVLDKISAPDGGEHWPRDLWGKRFHVAGVTWVAPAPTLEARAICFLSESPVQF